MAAKSRIKRKKKQVNAEDAKQTKRFFTITGICVVVLLVIIFVIFNNS